MNEPENMFIGVILAYDRNVKRVGESMLVVKVFLKKSQIYSTPLQMSAQMSLWRNGAQGVVIAVQSEGSHQRYTLGSVLSPVLFIRVTGQSGSSTSFPVTQNLQEWFNTPGDQTAIQRDLGSLKKQSDRNLVELHKRKC